MSDANNAPAFSRCRCPTCGRSFGSPRARHQHEVNVHSPKALARRSAEKAALASDREPSMADLVVDASVNRAMGVRNEDWIEGMFGDYL